ncbi:MAG: class I SAM-dependent RNA methyltransferase [Deltaproteobacteria bacterium]|nr:class I SAM-dependent RNA methyltransferase [Deltaproteobacteria bacterium]
MPTILELEINSLAAGGDGVARDANGRVTFIPRTAPGDRARVRTVQETKTFARAELVEVLAPGAARVDPPCRHFLAGCGGCQWLHVARADQLAAKQAIAAGALRKLEGLTVHPIADAAPALGWRRRARFHVGGGSVGLYQLGTHRIVPIDHCPQLEPALDAAYAAVASTRPPAGELTLLLGHQGDVAVGTTKAWGGAPQLLGKANIRGLHCGADTHGDPVIEIEPGLWGGPWSFSQASASGNQKLIELTRAAVGPGAGALLELYAGAGNLTRSLVAAGWRVTASDLAPPARPIATDFIAGPAGEVVERARGPYDAIVLDPPRTGAAEAVDGILRLAPTTIVYVSCDPATLARDATRLAAAGYRATDAWPIDLMPQTSHVEVVLRLARN